MAALKICLSVQKLLSTLNFFDPYHCEKAAQLVRRFPRIFPGSDTKFVIFHIYFVIIKQSIKTSIQVISKHGEFS